MSLFVEFQPITFYSCYKVKAKPESDDDSRFHETVQSRNLRVKMRQTIAAGDPPNQLILPSSPHPSRSCRQWFNHLGHSL